MVGYHGDTQELAAETGDSSAAGTGLHQSQGRHRSYHMNNKTQFANRPRYLVTAAQNRARCWSSWTILVAPAQSGDGGAKPGMHRELQQPFLFPRQYSDEQAEMNRGSNSTK